MATLRKSPIYRVPQIKVVAVREFFERPDVNKAENVVAFFRQSIATADWFDQEKECCAVLLLNQRNRLVGWNLVSVGSHNATMAHPREVLRAVIAGAASAFVLLHNHPSGDPSPSAADTLITRAMRDAAKTCEIPMIDHVIVGDEKTDPTGRGFFSFAVAGLM